MGSRRVTSPSILARNGAQKKLVGEFEGYGPQPVRKSGNVNAGFTGCGKTRPWYKTSRLCNMARLQSFRKCHKMNTGFSPCGNDLPSLPTIQEHLPPPSGLHHRYQHTRLVPWPGVNRDGGRFVIPWFCLHDVGHKCLRIAVIQREPAALNLHQYRVSGLEYMIHIMQREFVFARSEEHTS